MATFEERIGTLKKKLEELNTLKIKTETQLATYEENKNKIVEEMKALGFTPDTIEKAISDAEKALETDITKLEKDVTNISEELAKLND